MRFADARQEQGFSSFWSVLLALICVGGMLGMPSLGRAQTGGMAGIQGLVQDPTGAVVPNATVTAISDETHVATVRQTSGEGIYTISPLMPGSYTVKVEAPGFAQFQQTNFVIDALKMTPLNVVLKAGAESETVIVSEAPPALDTNSATLGSVMENKQYAQLPVQIESQQRDPMAFATLMPGAQGGTRAPVIAGTSNYLSELYLDGIPLTVANQQGDNRVISNAVAMDAIDQFQVQTSSIPPEFQGAGVVNFTMKHGGADYHGSANIYVRNTIFDTWTYAQRLEQAQGTKPNRYENKNEITGTLSGPVPLPQLRNKLFFFYSYMRFHSRVGADPVYLTAPNARMQAGDFSQLLTANGGPGYVLYDPNSQATCIKNNPSYKGGYCRYPFGQTTGVPDASQATNIIPSSMLSPISKYLQKFLPSNIDNTKIVNNYLGGAPTGYDNQIHNARIDYHINDNQSISLIYARGVRINEPYTYSSTSTLPYPYVLGSKAKIIIDLANVYHTYTITPHMVNNMKFGFMYYGGPPITAATDTGSSSSIYSAVSAGITNLPTGQASNVFPALSFGSGTYSPLKWTTGGGSGATYTSKSLGYNFGDNLLYTMGRHSLTFGLTYQILEANGSTYDGASSLLGMTYSSSPTAQLSSTNAVTNTGFEYASFLLGGVSSTTLTTQQFGVVGGRYRPFAPYVNDDYQVTSKLTMNLGFRWDYLPPYTEAKDRWSFLNPALTNPLTGNLGMMQFAGHGDYTCNCRTPVKTWWKNFGPRLGLSYQVDSKTVIHAGYGMYYSHGGGVGGRTGAFNGTGQNGFSASAAVSAANATAPAFWLNSSNSAYGGAGYTLPSPVGVSLAGEELGTSNYVDAAGYHRTSSSVGYADPYLSGRAPNISFFNAGVQRSLRNSLTIAVNYSGSETHFLPTGSTSDVGYWSNQLDPRYMVGLATTKTASGGNILSAQATSANIAIARAAMGGVSVPYAQYEQAGAASANATIQQMLVHFPQYVGVTNTWGQNVGNNSYHSVQVSLIERGWKGLNYQLNYAFSKNIGDDGTYRDGYDIPADAIDAGGKSFKRGRADRSWTAISLPQTLNFFGVYSLPFGKGKIGGKNEWVSMVASNWGLSWKYKYSSGNPLAIIATSSSSIGGTSMPNLNPDYNKKSVRTGSWALGKSGIDSNAFYAPAYFGSSQSCTSNCVQKFGNAPRTRAYSLSEPSTYNLDMSMKRQFALPYRNFKLSVEANCTNVTHKHTFGDIGVTLPTATYASSDTAKTGPTRYYNANTSFGVPTSASGNRDWQFAGHITF